MQNLLKLFIIETNKIFKILYLFTFYCSIISSVIPFLTVVFYNKIRFSRLELSSNSELAYVVEFKNKVSNLIYKPSIFSFPSSINSFEN